MTLHWTNDGGEPGLLIDAPEGSTVLLEVHARFGFRDVAWRVGPWVLEAGLPVPLEVPEEAWVDELQASYVTDVVAIARMDGRTESTPPAVLVWPGGRSATPVVWTAEEQVVRAPQGVVDASLRRADLDAGARVMPPVAWPAPIRSESSSEVEP